MVRLAGWRRRLLFGGWLILGLMCSPGPAQGAASSVVFGNFVHTTVGVASLSDDPAGLMVSGFGAGGQDGVSVDLQELSRTARVGLEPVALSGLNSRRLIFTARGMVNDIPDRPLMSLVLAGRPGSVGLGLANVLAGWVERVRVEVYNGSLKIGQVDGLANEALGSFAGDARVSSVIVGQSGLIAAAPVLWELEFPAAVTFTGEGGGAGLSGNRVRVLALGAPGNIQNFARLVVTGGNLGSLVIREESAPRFQPRLRVERGGGRIQIWWDTRSAALEQAASVRGPWTTVVSETNRFELPETTAHRFFRVQTQPVEPCNLRVPAPLGYVCKRNVLFVVLDDVGVDQLPIYAGYYNSNASAADDILVRAPALNPAALTPTIDRLAASGVTFLNAWSSPTCSPSRAGFFTGTSSFRHGVYSPTAPRLATNATTIARVLGANGYSNGLFGKWHLGADTSHLPTAFGWNRHEGALGGELDDFYDWIKDVDVNDSTGRFWVQASVTNYATYENVDNALAWIGTQAGPWMTTVTFNAPHWANDGGRNYYQFPPAGCANASRPNTDKGKYRSMLECADTSLNDLLSGIDSNVLAQTTIILIGDNGTDGPISDHFPSGHTKASLYEGGINVPLIIADGYTFLHGTQSPWAKGLGRVLSPGRFETNLVQTMDIFATAAEIGRADGSCGVDSVSMVPYLNSSAAAPQRSVTFAETYASGRWNVTVRNQTHKLIVKDYCGAAPTYELYDLSTDRWETTVIPENGTSPTATALLAELATLLAVPSACPVTPEYAVPTICP